MTSRRQHLPRDLAAAVEVVSWQEFQSLLPVATPPAASEVGQEWTAPDGQLWRVMQARNPETGQFLADEPTTAAKESLTWAEVTS